jgi:hypothetical protein
MVFFLVLLVASGTSRLDAQVLRIYPKRLATTQLADAQVADSSFWFGPSVGFDVFVRESVTGSYRTGIIPGVGYGAKWASSDGRRVYFGIDLFLQGAAVEEDDAHDGLDYFNIDVLPVATLLNWVSVGLGPRFKMGLDKQPSTRRWIFSFGVRKAT